MEHLQNVGSESRDRKKIDLVLDSDENLTVKVDGRHYPVHIISEGQVVAEIEIDTAVADAIGMGDNMIYGGVNPTVEFRCYGKTSQGGGLLCAEQRCYVQSCRRISANRKILILRRLVNVVSAR